MQRRATKFGTPREKNRLDFSFRKKKNSKKYYERIGASSIDLMEKSLGNKPLLRWHHTVFHCEQTLFNVLWNNLKSFSTLCASIQCEIVAIALRTIFHHHIVHLFFSQRSFGVVVAAAAVVIVIFVVCAVHFFPLSLLRAGVCVWSLLYTQWNTQTNTGTT